MKHCPITYEEISDAQNYSERGLKLLSPQLTHLAPLQQSAHDLRTEAITRAGKMSIQGVQPKLSAILKIKAGQFEIVDQGGRFILKPPSEYYPELPENEAITMSMAAALGIEVPLHGLLYARDKTMTYFIKRFDRKGHQQKFPVEDFAQLNQQSRETKYSSSMEKVAQTIFTFCSFPKVEAVKLLRLVVFNFLVGNEDMHLKNFSLITENEKISLSPAYDLLNTSIAQPDTQEEMALPLNGKKRNLKNQDFFSYYALEHLKLNENILKTLQQEFEHALPAWKKLLEYSFLSAPLKAKYIKLLAERWQRLGF